MAGIIGRTVSALAKRVIVKPANSNITSCATYSRLLAAGSKTQSKNACGLARLRVASVAMPKCSCRCLYTEGDAELSKFLASEIDEEKKAIQLRTDVPKLSDWKIDYDDTEVTLSKTASSENIKVKFSIVNSVDMEIPVADPTNTSEEQSQDGGEMLSKPPFVVEIKKPSGKTLTMNCSFINDDGEMEFDEAEKQEDTFGDKFEIDDVAVYEGEMKDTIYSSQSATMDASLYDMLMDMLDDRGIGNDFVDDLMKFSTNYEQKKYITFLQDLRSFIEEK